MVSVTARRSLKSPSVYAVLAAALPKAQVWEGLGTTIGGGWGEGGFVCKPQSGDKNL